MVDGSRGKPRRSGVLGGRTARRVVRCTPEEDAALELRAREQGVSVAELLISSALDDSTASAVQERREAMKVLFGLQRELGKIGVNVNQLAHVANTFHEVPSSAEATFVELRRLAERIDDVTQRMGDAL